MQPRMSGWSGGQQRQYTERQQQGLAFVLSIRFFALCRRVSDNLFAELDPAGETWRPVAILLTEAVRTHGGNLFSCEFTLRVCLTAGQNDCGQ